MISYEITDKRGDKIQSPEGADVLVAAEGVLVVRIDSGSFIWRAWSPGNWKRVDRKPSESNPGGVRFTIEIDPYGAGNPIFTTEPMYDLQVVNGAVVVALNANITAHMFGPGFWLQAGRAKRNFRNEVTDDSEAGPERRAGPDAGR